MNDICDIIVTTPKNKMADAAEEARQCIEAGGGYYFRKFPLKPKGLQAGSRIFYVENGYIRGFAKVSKIQYGEMVCDTTGKDYGVGYYATMPAWSWKWIKALPMKGFQGFRYLPEEIGEQIEVIGDWTDPKPII